jgi:hypothetical protein
VQISARHQEKTTIFDLSGDIDFATSPGVRQSVLREIRESHTPSVDVNSENIDELLDNLRHLTENLKEFTATIKTRPYTLIRANNPREHRTGEQQ